eukprot:jgi/Psemu1/35240/gm1.35240_g
MKFFLPTCPVAIESSERRYVDTAELRSSSKFSLHVDRSATVDTRGGFPSLRWLGTIDDEGCSNVDRSKADNSDHGGKCLVTNDNNCLRTNQCRNEDSCPESQDEK